MKRVTIAALHLTVAWLFLRRSEAKAHGSAGALAAAVPSMLIGAVALKLVDAWTVPAQVVFGIAGLGVIGSLLTLGRSFAFFPARRELVARGPYRVVRHPAYACEGLMIAACALSDPWPAAPLALAVLVALVIRIRAEEAVLSEDEVYAAYRSQVKWRLVPYLY